MFFCFMPCQVGSEKVLQSEIRRDHPSFRIAYSRPGFLTFKVNEVNVDPDQATARIADVAEHSVFARTASLSLGKAEGDAPASIADAIWQAPEVGKRFIHRVHVFRRDPEMPGRHGFEPGLTPELNELKKMLVDRAPRPKFFGFGNADPEHPALPGETVLDVVQVEADRYFFGVHEIFDDSSIQAYYPGGVMPISLPDDAVSRAWLKFEEGLRWSGLPIDKNACCVDIGASPGGGSQVLLQHGARVLGVDPAEMSPLLLKHPGFTHIRGRINQTKRSLYRDARWLIADMNVAPGYTLNVLEELLARKETGIRGMLFTLKLFQPSMAERLPFYAERVRSFGFGRVRIKQLAFNRREVMVSALKTD